MIKYTKLYHIMWLCLMFTLLFNVIAVAQNATPWRTNEGRACIREWMELTLSRLNASDLGKDYNERKPWRFSQYGVLLGKDSWTNAAPDLFGRYENVEHWVWAHYNRNEAGRWTGSYSFFENSTVSIPSCSTYVRVCFNGNGSSSPAGAVQTTVDFVQKSERLIGDGTGDWAFPIRLTGEGTIVMVSIANISGEFSVWDTVPGNGMWATAVTTGGELRNSVDGSISLPVRGTTDIVLYVADNGTSLANGNTRYRITIRFSDGRIVTIDPATSNTAQIPVNSPSGFNLTTSDYVQKSEKLAGDGTGDWATPIRLTGEGTIVMVSVTNITGVYSAWDTVPGNGPWCVGVATGGQLRNSVDGSISLPVSGTTDIVLYVADNGTLFAGNTRYRITIRFSDGRTVTIDPATSNSAQIPAR